MTARQRCSAITQGEYTMFDLSREVIVKDRRNAHCDYRTTDIANTEILEYESRSGYKSLDISIHNAQLDTISMKTKTHTMDDGSRFKVKTIEFLDSDGVSQSIKIFGEHY